MAYNNFFSPAYSPYQYATQVNSQFPNMAQPQQPQGNSSVTWVQGEAGAKSYLVAPNSTVILWDTESQTIYVKSADASGMPSIKTLDYTMRENMPQTNAVSPQKNFASKDDVDYLKGEIEALKAKFEDKESKKK